MSTKETFMAKGCSKACIRKNGRLKKGCRWRKGRKGCARRVRG